MNVIGNGADQECGRRLNNRAENSHQPFRRRDGAMSKFRDIKTLRKFAAVHASTVVNGKVAKSAKAFEITYLKTGSEN
jgi:transposase-like protein